MPPMATAAETLVMVVGLPTTMPFPLMVLPPPGSKVERLCSSSGLTTKTELVQALGAVSILRDEAGLEEER